jgi:outer membrane lipoprotein-sorting protein
MRIYFGLFLLLWATCGTRAAERSPLLASWLTAQTNLQTWSADFVQTRSLKTLTQPLTATGQVWFAAPNRFRWEMQHPAQTIAVRAPQELLVIYPRLKRVERFPLTGGRTGQWRDALALLEAGFPRSQAELDRQFNVLSQTVTNGVGKLTLQPRSASARRLIPEIRIELDNETAALRATELRFADGSSLRNDFHNQVLNPKVEPSLLDPSLPADFKIVEPLKP